MFLLVIPKKIEFCNMIHNPWFCVSKYKNILPWNNVGLNLCIDLWNLRIQFPEIQL